jgi:hypothetical protein|tara:strand:+ start:335 stop:520 length:186 start_codon:yes stop_codon:yes gene_type:complete
MTTFRNNKLIDTIIREIQDPIEKSAKSKNKLPIDEVFEKLNTIDINTGKEQERDVNPNEIP